MPGNLFHYIYGFLRIKISGNHLERFINACSHRGIYLWNLSTSENYYEMNITIKDYKKLKPVIRKTKTKVIIVERSGFPFFLYRFRNRRFFFAGFMLCILAIIYFSTFIWNIKITGNYSYSTEDIIRFLESIEVSTGMKSSSVKCSEISRQIREKYDDVIWVSSSLEGSNLIISIKENEDSKNIILDKSENLPYDLVAEDDFEVTRIIPRAGIVNVKEGDIIKKGTVLVSGQIPIYNDAKEIISYQYCVSDAEIYGKKEISYEDKLCKTIFNKDYYEIHKTEYFVKIGDLRFRLGSINNEYDTFEEHSKQTDYGIVSYGYRHVNPYKKIKRTYLKQEIQKILTDNFTYYCNELKKKGVVILKNNVKIYTWSDEAKALGTLTLEMPIGHKAKSEILETGDYIDGNDGNNN